MTKASKRKMEYIANYEAENYDKVLIRLPKGTKTRVQATGESINGFINRLVKAALDGPQPAQVPQPQPQTTTAMGDNVLLIEYPPDKLFNERIRILIDAGITPGVSEYIGPILFDELDRELSYNGVSLWRYKHSTIEPRHK